MQQSMRYASAMPNTVTLDYKQVAKLRETHSNLTKAARHFLADGKEPLSNEAMCEIAMASGRALGCIDAILQSLGIHPDETPADNA